MNFVLGFATGLFLSYSGVLFIVANVMVIKSRGWSPQAVETLRASGFLAIVAALLYVVVT